MWLPPLQGCRKALSNESPDSVGQSNKFERGPIRIWRPRKNALRDRMNLLGPLPSGDVIRTSSCFGCMCPILRRKFRIAPPSGKKVVFYLVTPCAFRPDHFKNELGFSINSVSFVPPNGLPFPCTMHYTACRMMSSTSWTMTWG